MRRYSPIKPSLGTRWDPAIVQQANELHRWRCLGAVVGMPGDCSGQLEPDHIRASGAMGMKSRSTLDNCAPLCSVHHRLKTREGRTWRPLLIEAVERALSGELVAGDADGLRALPGAQPFRREGPLVRVPLRGIRGGKGGAA